MKKRYKLDSGLDTSITLEIDTEMMPEALAQDINNFWVAAERVLVWSDGDIYQAVARRAATWLIGYLLEGYHEGGAIGMLSGQEGWPTTVGACIKIIDHEIPDLDALAFEVEDLTEAAHAD